LVSRESNILFVCLNGEIFLRSQVDGIVKGGGSFFAVGKDSELKNLARNFLEHDERGVGDFKEGFEFGGLIARGLGGKNGFGRIPRHEARVKPWSVAFFSGCDLIGFKTDFNGQILGDNIKKSKGTFRDFLGKS
jgi:hypothetical protein